MCMFMHTVIYRPLCNNVSVFNDKIDACKMDMEDGRSIINNT